PHEMLQRLFYVRDCICHRLAARCSIYNPPRALSIIPSERVYSLRPYSMERAALSTRLTTESCPWWESVILASPSARCAFRRALARLETPRASCRTSATTPFCSATTLLTVGIRYTIVGLP